MALSFASIISCANSSSIELKPLGEDFTLQKTIEVAGRQGVACDGEFYYVSSSTALYKYTLDGELVLSNESPFTSLPLPCNHLGDIDVYNGDIYAGAETFIDGVGENIQIAVYDAQTLQFKYSMPWNADSGQVEVCGLSVDASNKRVWMADWVQGHELYCYDLTTHEYIGKTTLNPAPGLQQGLLCYHDRILISSDDGDAEKDLPDHLYEVVPVIGGEAEVTLWREMDDFLRAGEIEGLTVNPDTGELIVLSNRGSRIVLGMVKGFYDGYDREIHELYVYKGPQVRLVREMFPVATKQGSFVCDGFLVSLSNDGHAIAYSLPGGEVQQSFDLASVDKKPHCNVANSIVKGGHTYAYITEWNGDRRFFVEDIKRNSDTGEWSASLVQTFSMDIDPEISGYGYRDWVVDFDNNKVYALTYLGKESNNDRVGVGTSLLEFKLKGVKEGDYTYTEKDILRHVTLPMINATQDKEIRDGKLYISAGITTKNPSQKTLYDRVRRISVIDLKSLSVEKEYSLQFYNQEPEGLDFYDGKMIMTFNRDKCWEIALD